MEKIPPTPPATGADTSFEELGDVERLKRRNRLLEKMLRDNSNEHAAANAIASAIAENVQARPSVPQGKYRSKKVDPAVRGAILDIGDTHWGETVQARNTGGLFAYNTEISNERLDYTLEEAIEIARAHKIGELSLILGGDLVSGAIHDDLNRHNEMMVAEQTVGFAEVMYAGLEKLLSAGLKLDVTSVSGNHGRTYFREKGYFKNKAQENYDWMVVEMLKAHGKNQKGLTIHNSDTVWAILEVAKRRFLTMHGDTNKQQNSMGISFYAVEKEMRRMKTMIADETIPFHHDIISHHRHQQFMIPIGNTMFYNNGALKGPDEYGMMGLRAPEQAQQQMLIVEDGQVKAHYPIISQHIGTPVG